MVKDKLKNLTKKEKELIPRSYDILGDLLIFTEFPKELKEKEKKISEEILKTHKNIKVVLKKIGNNTGIYRTPSLKIIAGEKRKETIHKENGVKLKLHPEKTYFSPRLSTERKRIYQKIKPGETILVMFSGAGPYPITISKNTSAKEIIGIEINPFAHKYAEENLLLNKTSNVKLILGDVFKVLPTIKKKFDRIIMPLPKGAEEFLDLALNKINKKGTVHLYGFYEKNDVSLAEKKIKKKCQLNKKKCKTLSTTKCGQYGPGKHRVCMDIKMF